MPPDTNERPVNGYTDSMAKSILSRENAKLHESPAGVDIRALEELLGHHSLSVTQVYLHTALPL